MELGLPRGVEGALDDVEGRREEAEGEDVRMPRGGGGSPLEGRGGFLKALVLVVVVLVVVLVVLVWALLVFGESAFVFVLLLPLSSLSSSVWVGEAGGREEVEE